MYYLVMEFFVYGMKSKILVALISMNVSVYKYIVNDLNQGGKVCVNDNLLSCDSYLIFLNEEEKVHKT